MSPEEVDETDVYWMNKALELAQKAGDSDEVPIGSVLISENNQCIGEGWNQPISTDDPTAHAEILALRDAAKRLNNYR
ncbi:MAG TPA: tRNA-specific adenosine deaminase, partial [Gammaproteobacteria bacterium]|nr:tRNA-specific adenosine deaminase [Gammaproteobacteria bacterium]